MHMFKCNNGNVLNIECILDITQEDYDYRVRFHTGLEPHSKGFFSDKSTFAESASMVISRNDYLKLIDTMKKIGCLH